MAQLGIRDKDYRPNQYINPMLISQRKEPAMGYGPYKIFDKNNPEHPDYKADEDDDDDIQLSLPLDYVKNKQNQDMTIANARLPFINIDNLEDPVGTLRDSGYPDPDVLDFPSGGNYRKGSDVLDRLIDLELVKGKKNQNMTIAQGPELGGTGRKLTLSEYRDATDNAFSNLMNSDMTDKDFEDYLETKKTARRQMFDGV